MRMCHLNTSRGGGRSCALSAERREKGEPHLDARSDDGDGRDSMLGHPVSYVFSKDGLGRCAYSVITAAPIFEEVTFLRTVFVWFGKFEKV